MPSHPRFRISGSPICPAAQRAGLALVLRGRDFEQARGSGCTRLLIEQPHGLVLAIESPVAMLELIEDLHPEQPLHPADPALRARHRQLIAAADAAQGALQAVTAARNLRDLDIAAFALRQRLLAIEGELRHLPTTGRSNLDIALGPLVWRLAVLDRRYQLHLGDDLPAATQRLAQLLARPESRRVLSRANGRAFLHEIGAQGAAVAMAAEDWDRCFDGDPGRKVLPMRRNAGPSSVQIAARPVRQAAFRHDW